MTPFKAPSRWRNVAWLLICGLIAAGCQLEEEVPVEAGGCSEITPTEAALMKSAIQHEIETSAELIAFQAFRAQHGAALSAVKDQLLFAKYTWENGGWEHSEATTGVTSFEFTPGSILDVDVAGEESVGAQIETADFTFILAADAVNGYPAGDVKSVSLGEWGAGDGVSAESFGSREKVLLRFPGGDWEETHDDEASSLSLTYSMPKAKATIWKKKKAGAAETVDITLNGVGRCAAAEGVLTAMFPDVWAILNLEW